MLVFTILAFDRDFPDGIVGQNGCPPLANLPFGQAGHMGESVLLENLPVLHCSHALSTVLFGNLLTWDPAEHCWCLLQNGCAVMLWYLPAGQLTQLC
jgi:hypothetical protein